MDAPDWSSVSDLLNDQIAQGAFPGVVAFVANQRVLYSAAFGHFTYDGVIPPYDARWPVMTTSTLFDMASCTKVLASTTAAAQLYQRGLYGLDWKVSDPLLLGGDFAQNGKGDITVRNLLLHNSGFPPDPTPGYASAEFGCPSSQSYEPPLTFSCRDRIYNALMAQGLQYPTGTEYVYSDLSMITMMFVIGKLARTNGLVTTQDLLPLCVSDGGSVGIDQCYYEAYVRKYVIEPLGLKDTGFLPPLDQWKNAAPCENDTHYLHRVVQGQVSDPNAYALGGVAGHAGLFTSAPSALRIMQKWLFAADGDAYLNKSVVSLFIREANHSLSSRALGWNTNDPGVGDMGWNMSCGTMFSPRTFMHTGYTGTMVCADPDNQVITVLLTNRVYPTDANIKIREARQMFGDAVAKVLNFPPPHESARGQDRPQPVPARAQR